ncbi:conserved hypothetical protein [Ricinus communis]|uniref:Uncharacterized protein n=1 Tax=Ricinus communis TaxID=3988 RepID=B9SMI0_RICCO|nr:conserved hypothetical protein [Ricinus communis]
MCNAGKAAISPGGYKKGSFGEYLASCLYCCGMASNACLTHRVCLRQRQLRPCNVNLQKAKQESSASAKVSKDTETKKLEKLRKDDA